MDKKVRTGTQDVSPLRERAEQRLAQQGGSPAAGTRADAASLMHELSVHQIELEMQNDELVRAKADLEASFDELYDFAPVGYLTLDKNGRILHGNLTAAEMLGIPRAGLSGRSLRDCAAKEFRSAYDPFLRRVFTQKDSQSCMVTLMKGGKVPVHVYIEAKLLGPEKTCRVMIVDTTSAMQAETGMHQSHERLTLALAAAGMGVWEWEYGEPELFCSPECCNITGIQSLCVKLETLRRVVHPDDLAGALAAYAQALAGRGMQSVEFRIMRPRGGVAWLRVRGTAKYGSRGQPTRLYGIVQDRTRRKLEEERVASALEDKDLLLREVHHRAGNNLRAIVSLVELCLGDIEEHRTRANLRDLQQRILAMALVHDSLSRAANLQQIDFDAYLKALAEQVTAALSTGSAIRLEVDVEHVTLGTEPALACGAIVSELLTNAFKYAFPGDKAGRRGNGAQRVRIRMRPADTVRGGRRQDAGTYTLSVADNGVGLPAGTDPKKSRSLGMTIVRMFAKQIGARVEVDRSRGTAYTFTFRVPAGTAPSRDPAGKAHAA